jgi:hypothetical protein
MAVVEAGGYCNAPVSPPTPAAPMAYTAPPPAANGGYTTISPTYATIVTTPEPNYNPVQYGTNASADGPDPPATTADEPPTTASSTRLAQQTDSGAPSLEVSVIVVAVNLMAAYHGRLLF